MSNMKVVHVIPAAFDYFDDIRAEAFSLMDNLETLGVTAEAFTVEFGRKTPSAIERGVDTLLPSTSRTFEGLVKTANALEAFASADIIHAHCPLLGMAGKIVHWKRAHSKQPLLVTYHRPVATPDFFSLLIVGYNEYYVPQLFALADAVAAPSLDKVPRRILKKSGGSIFEIDGSPQFCDEDLVENEEQAPLTVAERLALKYFIVYNTLAQS